MADDPDDTIAVRFDQGTLTVDVTGALPAGLEPFLQYDARIGAYRAHAYHYRRIVTLLHRRRLPYRDDAKAFERLHLTLDDALEPRPFQTEAIAAWEHRDRRGVVVLPTGSGKSFVARLAIAAVARNTLVIVPTLDLMSQWASQLERAFMTTVGLLGGGSRDVRDITVSTFDSAAILMEFIGNRFGFLIVDECHHLPGPTNRQVAAMCIAPFRLGLTATPECGDDGNAVIGELLGPIAYRRDIDQLEGDVLSPYRTVRVNVELDDDELQAYETNRRIYLDFIRRHAVDLGSPQGWGQFLGLVCRAPDGRRAFDAYLEQRRIARTGRAKIETVWRLLRRHRGERTIVFTADNNTAYTIGKRFLLPVLTHQTKIRERKDWLDRFRSGDYPVLVTSRVLNEGVDVPEAGVGIVVSGSGSVREHVQRLGRILRPTPGKQAVLYELVSDGTSETYVSERRRNHRAYQRPDSNPD